MGVEGASVSVGKVYKKRYQGVLPSLVLVSNPAIQYTIYEMLMKVRKRQIVDQTVQSVDVFWISALSKIVATFATYPLFVIKSRIQAMPLAELQLY